MSAPDTAYQIAAGDGSKDDNGEPLPKVKCPNCGWLGWWGELLGVDDEETLWCPQCLTSGWVFR